jgi:hypothetical protein
VPVLRLPLLAALLTSTGINPQFKALLVGSHCALLGQQACHGEDMVSP